MSESTTGVRVSHNESRRNVTISVPAGTSLDKIFRSDSLIRSIRGRVGPGGCETCMSGKDLHLNQFDEVINVELAE
jgi:hypothetical protein